MAGSFPMKLLDVVVLTEDIPEHGLRVGDVGTIVEVYEDGAAFEVEFPEEPEGKPRALLPFKPRVLRPYFPSKTT